MIEIKEIIRKIAKKMRKGVTCNANEKGKQQESSTEQHKGTDKDRQNTKAGGSNSIQKGRQDKAVKYPEHEESPLKID